MPICNSVSVRSSRAHELITTAFIAGANFHKPKEPPPPSPLAGEARKVLSYLSEVTGRNFRDTQSNLKPIIARLKEEGVTTEGMIKMIDRMWERWAGGEMEQYVRPSTLFRPSKFDSYYEDRAVKPKRQFGDLCYEES